MTGSGTRLRRPSRRVEACSALLAATAVSVLVWCVDPHHGGSYPTCPVFATTGLACPGCGSLRALNDMLHGDVVDAMGYNALFVAFLPVALMTALRSVCAGERRPPHPLPRWLPAVIVVSLALWTVLRNIPVAPWYTLAP